MASILNAGEREQLHRQLDEMLDRLPAKLEDLEGADRQLHAGLRELAIASMQAWAAKASTASVPPRCPQCGLAMRHRGLVERSVVTVHGTIVVCRPRRRCDRCGKEYYPHDDRLCFESHGVSWWVAEKVSRLASLVPSYDVAPYGGNIQPRCRCCDCLMLPTSMDRYFGQPRCSPPGLM